ncbi:hypothetical protein [Nostoc sp. UHCC 0251]|uniref:hypothetical protein n=1 Tax=Nostoc sp. UHCC 0251 TaxID=3110240 RepID=UPI002B2174CD|nr:hypothetical protein [Nostoc sp. UHCC 0251]MEA5622610.1 hypothetical protein [Nostoc sp. UHCC 0251]
MKSQLIDRFQELYQRFRDESGFMGASNFGGSTFLDEPYSRVFGVSELCFFQKWMLPVLSIWSIALAYTLAKNNDKLQVK